MSGDAASHERARAAAQAAARDAYGKLVAILAADTRNIAAAEDAIADAFAAALETWPRDGVPDKPEAWLLTVARRRTIGDIRRARVRAAAEPALTLLAERAEAAMDFPDERLKLLFVCAHPAINPAARTPLMLQTVLGLDAARIASAFLASPAAMGQRLVRAKTKIKEAGIAFAVPGLDELGERLDAVLAAIYAAFASGWEDLAENSRDALDGEAIWLCETLLALLPGEPEVRGLLALMLHCQARKAARRDETGAFVPLDRQHTGKWDKDLAARAERLLREAAAAGRPGRYQLEAAIQSVHYGRAATGQTDWRALSLLYAALAELAPTTAIRIGQAAVEGRVRGPQAGLQLLDLLAEDDVRHYQPYWAVRGHLLAEAGEPAGARDAFAKALGLTDDPALRAYLAGKAG